MKNKKSIRVKKVYSKWRMCDNRLLCRKYYKTSQIILEGQYLEAAGFIPNARIEIEISENQIIIKNMMAKT